MWDLLRFKDNVAVTDKNGRSISYEELSDLSEKGFSEEKSRSLLFLFCTNTLGSLIGYIGCLDHGIVPLMLDAKMNMDMVRKLIDIYDPAYLWMPSDKTQEYLSDSVRVAFESEGYCFLVREEAEECDLEDELALLINTSGSTGSPKLVRQSYENLLSNARSIAEYLGIDEKENAITSLPMNYVYGISVINSHIISGARVHITDNPIMSKDFWKEVDRFNVTSFAGVPFSYDVLSKMGFLNMKYDSLKTMTQAGGKLSKELQEKYGRYAEENGIRFFIMYGASEATSRMSYLPYDRVLTKPGSIGIPIPGGRFSIIDADGSEIRKPYEKGELIYEGQNVTLGYAYCRKDLAGGEGFDGKLHTGDLSYRDEEGYYYIVGRIGRFVKIAGKRISLDETEALIRENYHIEDLACTGDDDRIVLIFEDRTLPTADIVMFVSRQMEINPGYFRTFFVDSIPRNPSGKILYPELIRQTETL